MSGPVCPVVYPDEFPPPPETWPIIEHEEEHIPVVPPELCVAAIQRGSEEFGNG